MDVAFIKTPLGMAEIRGDRNGITSIKVLDEPKKDTTVLPKTLEPAVNQLQAYFEGRRTVFNLKINPQGTAFQKRVWQALLTIPYGQTLSYLQLSKKLGDAKAIRAVAAANGKNPLWVVVPCHRVIGSNGSLTGYAGGLHRKKWLLEHESSAKQQRLF